MIFNIRQYFDGFNSPAFAQSVPKNRNNVLHILKFTCVPTPNLLIATTRQSGATYTAYTNSLLKSSYRIFIRH